MPNQSFKYEIFGKVQGVFFRKHTHKEAESLGLVGWVMNTESGTVVGEAQGPADKVQEMKAWLRTKGSPKSQITKAVFTEEREVPTLSYDRFEIRGKD